MTHSFWKNKKYLSLVILGLKELVSANLKELGAQITGYALDPISKPNFFDDLKLSKLLKKDFRKDINNFTTLKNAVNKSKPDIIFHLAAQSSVLVSYKNPDTLKTNIIGTFNLLKAIRLNKSVKSAVIVTTDKVYLNDDKKINFNEESKLGGYDMYSSTKACCEIITQSYVKSFIKKNKCRIASSF